MTHLVLDLETVVDPSLPPPKPAKDGANVIPPAPYHQIVVLGAALLDAAYRLRRIWVVGEGSGTSEFMMLSALIAFLNAQVAQRNAVTIVGFNSRGFDLPVIVAQCLRHGLAWPWYYQQRDARYRFSTESHLDLMNFLTDHGAARFYSLDLAAKLIGMPGKVGCAGSDVAFQPEGRQSSIHCVSAAVARVVESSRPRSCRGACRRPVR